MIPSKNRKVPMTPAKGGTSQADIAATLHVGKRDVSAKAQPVREYEPNRYTVANNGTAWRSNCAKRAIPTA